jgi:hypothetical protein
MKVIPETRVQHYAAKHEFKCVFPPPIQLTVTVQLKVALNAIKQTRSKTIFNTTRMMTFSQLQPILGINQPEMSCLITKLNDIIPLITLTLFNL